jgi:preprotein translocase subunit SecD
LLATLAALLIVMLLAVLGGKIASPGEWHKQFKVGRGLDLASGTQITLQALPPAHHKITTGAMSKAVQILTDRIEGSGFTGATVVPQGTNQIVVSVPGQDAQKVAGLVGPTAVLALRQVLAEAPNYSTSASPTPSATPSSSTSPGAKPTPTSSASPSPTAKASPSKTTGSTQAQSASLLATKATPKPTASATPSPSAKSSPSPTSSPSPSPAASSSGRQTLSTTADAEGDVSSLTTQTARLFDKVNCDDKNWQSQIYGDNTSNWDVPKVQTVACYGGYKYALAPAVVQGSQLNSVSATLGDGGWQVNFGVNEPTATDLGKLTAAMADLSNGDPTKGLAVVLDGQLQGTPPAVQSMITTSGQITGNFTQTAADNLADILKYGQLPLTFHSLYTSSVSAQLGSDQLSAGLIAACIGLLLVVIYSFIYYRGLGVVSISSLAIAAALSYLSVVLLSKYESFTLSLAGIAGLIVAIGITADSFVVYFERLRDEVREGRSLRAAVERGWARARRTILVSDTVSFLAALLLYILSIGDVREFAFTLGMTTLIDVLVVFLFTKPMVTLLARTQFYGQGHKLSGLDPARLGARSPWRGSRPAPRPATGGAGQASATSRRPASTKEA